MRGNAKHEQDMKDNGIKMIDLVVLNLYAFEDTVAKGYNFETCIENIDIGGPSMLRSSAKNHAAVVICSSPAQYPALMEEMKTHHHRAAPPLRRGGLRPLRQVRRGHQLLVRQAAEPRAEDGRNRDPSLPARARAEVRREPAPEARRSVPPSEWARTESITRRR